MFASLRSRLWLTYLLIIGVVLIIVGLAFVLFLFRNPPATRLKYEELNLLAAVILQREDLLSSTSPQQVQRSLELVDQRFGARVVILDPEGIVLADSRSPAEPPLPSSLRIQSNSPSSNQWFRDERGRIWLYVSRSLPEGNTLVVSALRPRIPLRSLLGDEFLRPFWRAGLISLLLALFLAFWIARWVAAPLQRIARQAKAISEGEYHPIPPEGPSEVIELTQAFNEMSARVQSSQQSQRDFVANVSHELKTPLTSIQGFAQAILDGTAETPEELQQAAGVIYSEAGRMHRMVMELLDLARIDAGTVEFRRLPIDLNPLLQDVVEKFKPQAKESEINLMAEIEPVPPVTGDSDRLAQVFTNLLDNAIKFTPPGGIVRLRAGPSNNQAQITVEDSGPGLAPEEFERIFERFYQVDRSRPGGSGRGAGLGLAIAREIIEAHHGQISAHSNPGEGTIFVVRLPLAP
jgi:two-component system OmpR family sensor kinase